MERNPARAVHRYPHIQEDSGTPFVVMVPQNNSFANLAFPQGIEVMGSGGLDQVVGGSVAPVMILGANPGPLRPVGMSGGVPTGGFQDPNDVRWTISPLHPLSMVSFLKSLLASLSYHALFGASNMLTTRLQV